MRAPARASSSKTFSRTVQEHVQVLESPRSNKIESQEKCSQQASPQRLRTFSDFFRYSGPAREHCHTAAHRRRCGQGSQTREPAKQQAFRRPCRGPNYRAPAASDGSSLHGSSKRSRLYNTRGYARVKVRLSRRLRLSPYGYALRWIRFRRSMALH